MSTITVLIADDSELIRDLLSEIIAADSEMKIVGKARDGEEALHMIKSMKPDVVLLDVVMPKLDGLAVLDMLHEDPEVVKQPIVLMLSAIGSEYITDDAFARGADYYLMKPFSAQNIIRQVKHVYKMKTGVRKKKTETTGLEKGFREICERQTTMLLHELGIPTRVKGFQYVRDGVLMYLEDQGKINFVTKILYPEIAAKNGTKSANVERGVRTAIDIAYSRGNIERLHELFGVNSSKERQRPTCSEFIAVIAEDIRRTAEQENKG
ncbi:MAG: sporulation transcription factor Spo0A [Eubacteriales bacterium]|nr:sporulation transcription factor Spo0A [Eubacteriales bacterium]